jgi:HAD superfamily hydrolase (TIGR01490 family)
MNTGNSSGLHTAFFDIDGTLTSERTWKGFMDYFRQKGTHKLTYVRFISLHYALYFLYRLGFVSARTFRGLWAADLAWFLRNETSESLESLWDWSVTYLKPYFRKDIIAILNQHQQAGDIVCLVSSAPLPLVKRFADEFGVDHAVGTIPLTKNGRYTGHSRKPVCNDINKVQYTKQYFKENQLTFDPAKCSAYADSITDLALLEMVANPVAVYPDKELQTKAEERGWRIFPPYYS